MGRAPNWTRDELDYLEEKWGVASLKSIAKHLGRSVEGVKLKAGRIGLSDSRFVGLVITLNQLANALNTEYSVLRYWVDHCGLPAKAKVFAVTRKVLVVEYDDFWKWAKQHKNYVNFARLEPGLLGPEPDWAKDKRKADQLNFQKLKVRVWTPEEDAKLRSMVNAYCYSYTDISKALRRSEAAIKRRLYSLNIKARPVRNAASWWSEEQVKQLEQMLHDGYGFNTMAEVIGKSGLAIRGKLEQMGYRFHTGEMKVAK